MEQDDSRHFIDAHLHLQDPRLDGLREAVVQDMRKAGVVRWAINATREDDWQKVAELALEHAEAVPSFGIHPWQIGSRRDGWLGRLRDRLLAYPWAAVGEIGLDKWIRGHDIADQEKVFRAQLELAVEMRRPAMVHCLKCFGKLLEVLRDTALPKDYRFLLHSYGGPAELVDDFVELGAMFSFSGYFLEARKSAAREVFRRVPNDRLLIESDAPDMPLPEALETHTLAGKPGEKRLNHPANLPVIYREVAKLRNIHEENLMRQVAINYGGLFP